MSLETISILACIVIIAGIIRGFTGFGFAAVAVVGMNIFLTPQQSIPVVLGLDILCCAPLIRQAIKQGDKPTFKLLTLGSIVGIPFGLGLLLFVPSITLKLAICIAILLFSALLIMDFRVSNTDKTPVRLGFGIGAGASTAAASVGGAIIVCYMLSSTLSAATQRATMIMFFVVSESLALAALFFSGLVGKEELLLIGILLIPTLIAVRVGQWLFNKHPPKSLKHFAIPILVMVALLGISASAGELSI
ncbi:sulfite exporter TauE/SafE family protein [Marinomonas sp. GJ51-6]|uniref:sulfite exporter TauE/SafE family protein n=1 Tax=Marinomonas sp. GJ51-6 TaxID=2992802 RepID=UPI0029353131|nr:sulfite exporter TauE/SafE family protein [Marinomonas sp. GJ51-6]WOD08089.1 sulfite exporter TauE/SafE family protein [Marinomonas sp. GJ51-6]